MSSPGHRGSGPVVAHLLNDKASAAYGLLHIGSRVEPVVIRLAADHTCPLQGVRLPQSPDTPSGDPGMTATPDSPRPDPKAKICLSGRLGFWQFHDSLHRQEDNAADYSRLGNSKKLSFELLELVGSLTVGVVPEQDLYQAVPRLFCASG
jgi:hypothetical protein